MLILGLLFAMIGAIGLGIGLPFGYGAGTGTGGGGGDDISQHPLWCLNNHDWS